MFLYSLYKLPVSRRIEWPRAGSRSEKYAIPSQRPSTITPLQAGYHSHSQCTDPPRFHDALASEEEAGLSEDGCERSTEVPGDAPKNGRLA